MERTSRAIIISTLSLLCAGCAITKIDHGNGRVDTSYTLLGPINRVNIPAEGAYVEIEALGIVEAPGQASLGAVEIKALSISPACRLVILSASDAQIEAWRKLLKDSGPLCSFATPRGDKTP